jgi:predicted dehydrogenase
MIRIGVIGLGMMGRMHYANWQKIAAVEVVAIADIDPKRAAGDLSGGWANIAGGASSLDMGRLRGTTDPYALIAMGDVDMVDICVPTPCHSELAVAALKADKHCMCEKPMARTLEQGRQIVQAAGKSRGFFQPAMCMRFWPEWAWLKRAIDAGTYGKVRDATFRRVGGMPPGWFRDGKQSGGAILDLHLHDTDFIKYAFGTPTAVSSAGYVAATGCVDHLVTRFLYDGGPMVHAEGGWGMADGYGFSMAYCVNFEAATAEYIMGRKDPLMVYTAGKAEPMACEGSDGYFNELSYMAQCIQTGQRPTIVPAADAQIALEVVDAERRSVESGKIVRCRKPAKRATPHGR